MMKMMVMVMSGMSLVASMYARETPSHAHTAFATAGGGTDMTRYDDARDEMRVDERRRDKTRRNEM